MAAEWQERIAREGFLNYLKAQRVVDRQLARVLRDAAIEAERLVSQIVPDTPSAAVRRAMFAQRSEALWRAQEEMWTDVSSVTRDGIRRSTQLATDNNIAIVEYLTAKGVDQALAENIRVSAARGSYAVRARLINNIDLSELVYKNQALSRNKVSQAVNRGLALGKSAREIASDVKGFIRPDVKGGTSYAAMRLGRTEINNAWHTMNVLAASEQPWVVGLQWHLSGSHPKPDVCNEYEDDDHDNLGKGVFKKDNVPPKPHPQCLCYTTTVTNDSDEFIDNLVAGRYDQYLASQGL